MTISIVATFSSNNYGTSAWPSIGNVDFSTIQVGDVFILSIAADTDATPTELYCYTGGTFTLHPVVTATNTGNTVTSISWAYIDAKGGNSTYQTDVRGLTLDDSKAMSMYIVRGLDASPFDKSANATGSGTTQSSGATGALSQADEFVVGAIGTEHKLTELAGSWTTGASYVSGNELSNGTASNGSAANQTIRSAAEIVSATTAQTAEITSEDDCDWAACIATFKGAGAGGQSITPTGIASSEALGTVGFSLGSVSVTPSAIASAEALGAADLVMIVGPTGIASAEALGAIGLQLGAVTITPTGLATSEALGTIGISLGAVSISLAAGITSAEAFGTALTEFIVTPSGLASLEALGAIGIDLGAITVTPTGVASQETIGTHQVSGEEIQYITPSGLASAEVLGTAGVTMIVSPTGLASVEALGTIGLQLGDVTITPTGLASSEALGTIGFSLGSVSVTPGAIASAEAFGTCLLEMHIEPTGLTTAELFGTHGVVPGTVAITVSGLASGEAMGAPTVVAGTVTLSPVGIATGEAIGSPLLVMHVAPASIEAAEAFGGVDVLGNFILPVGIGTEEAFGLLIVQGGTGAGQSTWEMVLLIPRKA